MSLGSGHAASVREQSEREGRRGQQPERWAGLTGFAGHSDFIPSQQRAPDRDDSNRIWLEFVLSHSGLSVENGPLCSSHPEHLLLGNSWASIHPCVFPEPLRGLQVLS